MEVTSSGDTITNENNNIVIHKNISNGDTLTITKGFSDGTISYTQEPSAIRDTNMALGIKQVSSLNDSYFTRI